MEDDMQHRRKQAGKTFIVFQILDWIRDVTTNIGIALLFGLLLLVVGLSITENLMPGTMRAIMRWIFGG